MCRITKLLYTIIEGKDVSPEQLGLRQGAPVGLKDISGQDTLFYNFFGQYSSISLDTILKNIKSRENIDGKNNMSLEDAVKTIGQFQETLDNEARKGRGSELIANYCELKGYSLAEIREQIATHKLFVTKLRTDTNNTLKSMLGIKENAFEFFQNNKTISPFGIIASGNLGISEMATLIDTGILAQAAENGHKFSLVIKPSIEDFLSYELIKAVPSEAMSAFNRITWRSDVAWDQPLNKALLNALDGAIYFGQRSSLNNFKHQLNDSSNSNHHWYYDHFPVLVIGEKSGNEQLREAAKLASNLCYKGKGEACLSLQDVFVHEEVYNTFLYFLRREVKAINNSQRGTPLPRYSRDFLEELVTLRNKLLDSGVTVSGKIDPENNYMDILLAYDVPLNNWVLSTENAAMFLAVSQYSDYGELNNALQEHLKPKNPKRTTDKHIYSITIGTNENKLLMEYLSNNSHMYATLEDVKKIKNFQAFQVGIPHCGGFSFLADMFRIPHLPDCYKQV